MTTGQRIKEARKAAGLTQKELGEKLGCSSGNIATWETNARKPKWDSLKKIAEALNVEVEALVFDAATKNKIDAAEGIQSILKDIYGHFESVEVSIEYPNRTVSSFYFEVGTGENRFVLHDSDIEELHSNIKTILPILVKPLKDRRPIAEIEQEILNSLYNSED